MDKFKNYNLKIDDKNKLLILEYLENIKNHVENNGLDEECYLDIEEMVFEKLSNLKQINDLNVKKIIKEVGEPREIFGENLKNSENNDQNFYQKIKANGWEYENKNAIVLGISSLLAKKLGLTTLIVRLVLLFLIIFAGFSIWIYFILGIFLPVKILKYNSKNISKLVYRQLIYVIKNSIKNIIKSFFLFFPYIIKKMASLLKALFKNIFPIFRFFVFCFLGIFFLCLVLLAVSYLGFYYSDFSIGGIYIFKEVSFFSVYGTIFGLLTVLILGIGSLFFAFGSKIFNKNLYILSIITFLVSIFFFIVSGLDLAKKYIGEIEFTQKVEYEFTNSDTQIDIDLTKIISKNYFHFGKIYGVEIIPTDENKIVFELTNTIYAGEKISNFIKNSTNQINLEKSQNNFVLKYENNKEFKNEIPLVDYDRKLIIYVPKNLKFKINPENFYYIIYNGESILPEYSKYGHYLTAGCNVNYIFYNENEQKFYCENNYDLSYARQKYIEHYLIRNFDNWSKITHKSKYKREYYNNSYNNFDWNVDEFNWIDENNLELTISDRTIKLTSKLEIKENENTVDILNQELEYLDFSNNYYDDEKKFSELYYNNIDFLLPKLDNLK